MAGRLPDLGPRYEPLRELGRGGMGRVFLVRDAHLGRDVALKLLHRPPPGAGAMEEAQREFTLLSRIEHPNVARAHDFGYSGGVPYFTMEYVPGRTLRAALPLAGPREVLGAARAVAEALECLHRSDILHLDIKPSNIMLPEEDPGRGAVLIDFGLCRRAPGPAPPGTLRGSLPYMAPELFFDGGIGPWTDVYAFGVTLYQAATGRLPRPGAAGRRTGGGRGTVPLGDEAAWLPVPVPPSRLRSTLPADLDHVILKCLALEPRARCDSPRVLLGRLAGGAAARAGPPRQPARPPTVGRLRELEDLGRFLDSLPDRAAGAARIVTGPHGIGMSHLLREAKLLAQTRGLASYLEEGAREPARAPGFLLRSLEAHMGDAAASRQWRTFLRRLAAPRGPPATPRNDTSGAERRLRRASDLAAALRAVTRPLVLIVDDLERFDEVTVSLAADMVRLVESLPAGERPPLRILLGYREEGTPAELLRDLTAALIESGGGRILTLPPLAAEEAIELFEGCGERRGTRGGGQGGAGARGLAVFQETGGVPARIIELAAGGSRGPQRSSDLRAGGALGPASVRPPGRESRALLLVLAAFGRPASAAELARALAWPAARAGARLRDLAREGCAEALPDAAGAGGSWRPGAAGDLVWKEAEAEERRRAHRRIARSLSAGEGRADGPRVVEVFRQLRAAGDATAIVSRGLLAARYLISTFQNAAALEALGCVLESLPATSVRRRVAVALQMAELHARVGALGRGVQVLADLLAQSPAPPREARLRLLLHLAVLHSRQGEFRRAASIFRRSLPGGREPRGLGRDELLRFLNEYAALRGFTGEYEEALRLCDRALRLAGRSRSRRVREVVLDLHSTRATVALRTHRYEDAARHFEEALEIADAIGSLTHRAVVLNNLGIVHGQCDRHGEAVRAFEEAERTCLRLDEGPSLVSIYGNLAVLHSKRGDVERARAALAEAERLTPGTLSERQTLFLLHARGLCRLGQGRFREAEVDLAGARALAVEMGDRHIAGFDRVYQAEAQLFQARYAEAAAALEEAAGEARPGRWRGMALARLSFLHAITADVEGSRAAAEKHAATGEGREIPFVDSWDRLYLGWAASARGDHEVGRALVETAAAFFRRHQLLPALSLASFVLAEMRLLEGDPEAAAALAGARAPGNDLTRVLWPLLEARALLDLGAPPRRIGDLLAEAGAALVGNPLPEWALRLDELRRHLRAPGAAARRAARREREGLARSLPRERRARYLAGAHWRLWTEGRPGRPLRRLRGRRGAAAAAEGTATIEIARPAAAGRPPLVALSPAMKRLARALDRLRESDLPVVIEGETGAGKEHVARLLHADSRRAAGPFAVVSCPSLPDDLFEAELFGARAGAYTGSEADRAGILERARGGTVLLDGIAELPAAAQAKLLRVLASGKARPLGSEAEVEIDVRFLFTAARPLEEEVKSGRLRPDLFHRLHVVTVRVPPLRERFEDFPELVRQLLEAAGGEPAARTPVPVIDRRVVEELRRRPWPGNVRELRNVLERLRMESPERIDLEALARVSGHAGAEGFFPGNLLHAEPLDSLQRRLERDYIAYHFRRLGFDTGKLCAFVGLSRRQLYRRCGRLGISLRGIKEAAPS